MRRKGNTILFLFVLIGSIQCQPLGSFSVNPSDKIVGETLPNQPKDIPFSISNSNAGKSFSLTDAKIEGDSASLFSFTKNDNSAAFPTTIAVGSTTQFLVKFSPTDLGVKVAQLTLTFDSQPSLVIPIRGLSKEGEGGEKEPSLQYIFNTFNFQGYNNIGDDDPSTALFNSVRANWAQFPTGPEIISRYFIAADPFKNVTVTPIACYGPNKTPDSDANPTTAVGVCPAKNRAGSTGCIELFQIGNSQGQTLNPTYTGVNSFVPTPNQPFSFYSRWPMFEARGDNGNVYGDEEFNTFADALPHHVRVYPYQNQQGNVIPDAYVLTWEEYTDVVDFQDVIVVVTNIRPSGSLKVENPAIPNLNGLAPFGFDSLSVVFPNTTSTNLVLRNAGTTSIQITEATFSNNAFALATTLPLTIAAGTSQNLTFTYTPSNNQFASTTAVLKTPEGSNQLSIPIYGVSGPTATVSDLAGSWGLLLADQISASSWTIADTSKSGYAFFLGTLSSTRGSTLRVASSEIQGSGSFQGQNTVFNISITDASGNINSSSLKFYVARNRRTSKLALNTWIVASESSVWYITNVQPVSSNSPFGSFSGPFYLDFSSAVPRSLLDSDGNSIGFTSFRSGYQPSLAQVSYSSKTLALTSSPSNNAPQVTFYGVTPVTVRAEISGLSNFGSSGQSFGVFVGTNGDNSVQLSVTGVSSSSATVGISVGASSSSTQTISLPLTSLILELTVDPYTKKASGSFRVNSDAFLSIPAFDLGSATIFDTLTHAGVFVSGSSSFTTTFSSFNLFGSSRSSQQVQSPLAYYGGSASSVVPSPTDTSQVTSANGPDDSVGESSRPLNTLSATSPQSTSSLMIISWGTVTVIIMALFNC